MEQPSYCTLILVKILQRGLSKTATGAIKDSHLVSHSKSTLSTKSAIGEIPSGQISIFLKYTI